MKTEVLDASKSQDIISKYLDVPETQVINSLKELKIKAPLVMKILSQDAIHKTEFVFVVSKGKLMVSMDEGEEFIIEAPYLGISKPSEIIE